MLRRLRNIGYAQVNTRWRDEFPTLTEEAT